MLDKGIIPVWRSFGVRRDGGAGRSCRDRSEHFPLQKAGDIVLFPVDLQHMKEEHGEQVCAAIPNPIMVFKSTLLGGAVAIMLEVEDQHSGNVAAPITLKKNARKVFS